MDASGNRSLAEMHITQSEKLDSIPATHHIRSRNLFVRVKMIVGLDTNNPSRVARGLRTESYYASTSNVLSLGSPLVPSMIGVIWN